MALELPLAVETHGLPPGPHVETLLFLHGFGASSFTWRYWTGPLGRRAHLVLVDLKGFGSAPKPEDDAYGPHEQAELVHRLILQRGLTNLTIVGHSFGGGVALLLALHLLEEQPSRLRRLVLLAPAAYRQKLPPFVWFSHRPRLASFVLGLLGVRLVVSRVLRQIVYDPTRVTRSQVEGYAEPLARGPARRALFRAGRAVVPEDLDEVVARYPSITVPVLLLWGRQDPVVPLALGERLATALPDGRLAVLDECGHLAAEEHAEDALEILEAFLDRTRSSP